MFDRIIRFIGSIKLAVPLLSTIIGILIWATFYESQVGSTTVQQEVYKSPWFGALMFLLAVNLGISALSRYPWRGARKIGFALTHFGLIVIIAGSAAVIHLGMEGMLLVRTDSGVNDRIRVEGDLLEVVNADGIERGSIFIKQDGTVSPKYLGGLELEAYTDNAVQTVNFAGGGTVDNPGVKLSLASDRMGQTIERTLAVLPNIYSKVGLGPAELEIVKTNSDLELNRLLHPAKADKHPWGELEIVTATKQRTFDVKANQSKTRRLGDIKIAITDFFPDFRLDRNKQPATASQNLNNPAVTLEISSPIGKERWFVFGKTDFPPIRTLISGESIENITLNYQVQPPQVKDYFKVIVAENNQLYYAAKSSTKFKSGSLALGQSVTPGWADFEITLEEYLPQAQLQRKIVPATDNQVQGSPALLVKTESGIETWLPWGEASAIQDGDREIYAAFSPKIFQLPFAIKLEDFIVDRNEGSESVAMWTSKIRIEDTQNNITEQRKVWMNHPTWYHGWKIAQASWNPGDLKQSTLQVKREPAWVTALTWIGSALVVLGIAVMFYAPALTRKLGKKPVNETKSIVVTDKIVDDSEKELTTVS
ncbi:MAG: cytochrome c biogenesis protein ResB [Pleurocapsa sp. MO_192.B19]|nr:cytochrome c biogenesis protein ResB [Pleurocapsa sp. MO_192.B19]